MTLLVLRIQSKEMTAASREDSGVPISELTLSEAESFLSSLLCLPEETSNKGKFYLTYVYFNETQYLKAPTVLSLILML